MRLLVLIVSVHNFNTKIINARTTLDSLGLIMGIAIKGLKRKLLIYKDPVVHLALPCVTSMYNILFDPPNNNLFSAFLRHFLTFTHFTLFIYLTLQMLLRNLTSIFIFNKFVIMNF